MPGFQEEKDATDSGNFVSYIIRRILHRKGEFRVVSCPLRVACYEMIKFWINGLIKNI